jgi:hypothetical protein
VPGITEQLSIWSSSRLSVAHAEADVEAGEGTSA